MLFVTEAGRGVEVDCSRKRRPIHLDRRGLRLMRARTFAAFQRAGLSMAQTGECWNCSASTVKVELAWLAQERAAGRDCLPWDKRTNPEVMASD